MKQSKLMKCLIEHNRANAAKQHAIKQVECAVATGVVGLLLFVAFLFATTR